MEGVGKLRNKRETGQRRFGSHAGDKVKLLAIYDNIIKKDDDKCLEEWNERQLTIIYSVIWINLWEQQKLPFGIIWDIFKP